MKSTWHCIAKADTQFSLKPIMPACTRVQLAVCVYDVCVCVCVFEKRKIMVRWASSTDHPVHWLGLQLERLLLKHISKRQISIVAAMTFYINIHVLNCRCKIEWVSIVHYPVIRGVTQSNNHSTTSFGPFNLPTCGVLWRGRDHSH